MAEDMPTAALEQIRGRAKLAYASPRACYESQKDVPRLLAALDAVLTMHAQTAYTSYWEPCTAHLSDILGRRTCTVCRPVERTGCERCRDENGHPAKPEDCREREAILGALLGGGGGAGE